MASPQKSIIRQAFAGSVARLSSEMNADADWRNEAGRTFRSHYWLRVQGVEYAGAGFLERVYENALTLELRAAGLAVMQQPEVKVLYCGEVVGEYFADLLVEDVVAVELKAVAALAEPHRLQCINFLKASNLHLCLLMNVGTPRLEIKRVVHQL